jgi:hypothetical protein
MDGKRTLPFVALGYCINMLMELRGEGANLSASAISTSMSVVVILTTGH